eukprot:gene23147-biopygen8454
MSRGGWKSKRVGIGIEEKYINEMKGTCANGVKKMRGMLGSRGITSFDSSSILVEPPPRDRGHHKLDTVMVESMKY